MKLRQHVRVINVQLTSVVIVWRRGKWDRVLFWDRTHARHTFRVGFAVPNCDMFFGHVRVVLGSDNYAYVIAYRYKLPTIHWNLKHKIRATGKAAAR
jgi:hypothetical protein